LTQSKHFPVFVVRMPNNEGCGHQHNTRKKAWNCADRIAHKRKNLSWIEVRKIFTSVRGLREQTVGRATKFVTCPECGGLVFKMDDDSERGHFEDCKVAPE